MSSAASRVSTPYTAQTTRTTIITIAKARAKRAGHMPPKMRYLAAQGIAMLEDGLWLELARNANRVAKRLAEGLEGRGVAISYPVDGNEVFAMLEEPDVTDLRKAGAVFYPWPDGSQRLVCSWSTTEDQINRFLQVLGD